MKYTAYFLSTMSLPERSIVRTPEYTLLTLKDGSVRALRDHDKKWSKDGVVDDSMPSWQTLETFLEEKKPVWVQVEFALDKALFATASIKYNTAYESWNDAFGEAHRKFQKKIVEPFISKYGLKRAADVDSRTYIYGTYNSPAALTAEQQFREMEKDEKKWSKIVSDALNDYMRASPDDRPKTLKRYNTLNKLWNRYTFSKKDQGPPRYH